MLTFFLTLLAAIIVWKWYKKGWLDDYDESSASARLDD